MDIYLSYHSLVRTVNKHQTYYSLGGRVAKNNPSMLEISEEHLQGCVAL